MAVILTRHGNSPAKVVRVVPRFALQCDSPSSGTHELSIGASACTNSARHAPCHAQRLLRDLAQKEGPVHAVPSLGYPVRISNQQPVNDVRLLGKASWQQSTMETNARLVRCKRVAKQGGKRNHKEVKRCSGMVLLRKRDESRALAPHEFAFVCMMPSSREEQA